MKTTATVLQMLVRLCGLILITLGILFWTGNAVTLIPVHMLLGLILVLSLWVLAALSVQAGVPIGMAAGAAVTGLIALVLGMTQDSLLPGGAHWVIQVLHLLVGMAAAGPGEMIGGRLRRKRLAPSAA